MHCGVHAIGRNVLKVVEVVREDLRSAHSTTMVRWIAAVWAATTITKQVIDMTPISYCPRYTMNYTFDVSAITPSKWAQSPHRVVGFSMASTRTMHGRNRFPCA